MKELTTIDQSPAAASPAPMMDLISNAVNGGADIEIVRELLTMKREVEADEARKAFDAAIAAIRKDDRFGPVAKNRVGHNNRRYADFGAYAAMLDPIIADYGVSYSFESSQSGGLVTVTCIVSHEAGHRTRNSLEAGDDKTGNKNAIQAVGSTLNYLQRYTLVQAFGLAATEDDDGHAAGTGELISDDQVMQLRDLAESVGADLAGFKKYLGVADLAELPAKRFDGAVAALNKKGQANG